MEATPTFFVSEKKLARDLSSETPAQRIDHYPYE